MTISSVIFSAIVLVCPRAGLDYDGCLGINPESFPVHKMLEISCVPSF